MFQKAEAFVCKFVKDSHRLALMNAILYGMKCDITLGGRWGCFFKIYHYIMDNFNIDIILRLPI